MRLLPTHVFESELTNQRSLGRHNNTQGLRRGAAERVISESEGYIAVKREWLLAYIFCADFICAEC